MRLETAACVAVGSELLGPEKLDTNSLAVTRVLEQHGLQVVEKRVIGDDVGRIAESLRDLLVRVHVVVVTGGLGGTADDVTRQAVSQALDRPLVRDTELERWLEKRYVELGRTMPEVCRPMADVVPGTLVLGNTVGAAPGLMAEVEGRLLVVLPGVPAEARSMLERDLVPRLRKSTKGRIRASRTLIVGGVLESEVEGRLRPLYERFERSNITILASNGAVRLVLSARGEADVAARRLDEMEDAFRAVLGDDVAGRDVSGLAEVVLVLLRDQGSTLATAESCTGGLVSEWLTEVPGSSEVLLGGVVSYSNQAKEDFLDVPQAMLVEHGAVSDPVAQAMALGARGRFGADWGLGVTGIAGPTGGTADKPVGLVHWSVAGPQGVAAQHRIFSGERSVVRRWSANAVLDLLRRSIGRG